MDILLLVERNGEMYEVQVQVFETKFCQAVVKRAGYIVGTMLRVPELGCDEDVLALEVGHVAAKRPLERTGNLLLVAIHLGEIEVTVSSLESLKDSGLNLTWLRLPSAKTQLTGFFLACGA